MCPEVHTHSPSKVVKVDIYQEKIDEALKGDQGHDQAMPINQVLFFPPSQAAYYWPSQNHTPDNLEYAVYLAKRSQRNRQKYGLEEYEAVSANSGSSLNLAGLFSL